MSHNKYLYMKFRWAKQITILQESICVLSSKTLDLISFAENNQRICDLVDNRICKPKQKFKKSEVNNDVINVSRC